jgi:phosphate acetyltransferase
MHESSEHRYLVNKTYEEIRVGDTSSLSRTLMPEDVKLFAVLTGDMNPGMADQHYSESGMFREVIAHGMWSGSLISTVLGTQFPGPGTILIDQSLHFARPVTIGDTITITVTAKQKFDHNKHVILDCVCTNQEGLQVVRGTAEVLAPSEKISHIRQEHMPSIRIDDKHERYMNLLASVKGLEPIPTAVATPAMSNR